MMRRDRRHCGNGLMESRGGRSRPVKVGHRPEASLAWTGESLAAKRRQRTNEPRDRAPKCCMWPEPKPCIRQKAIGTTPQWPGGDLGRGLRVRRERDDSPGTWEARWLPRRDRERAPRRSPRPIRGVPPASRNEEAAQRGIAARRDDRVVRRDEHRESE